jgi:hypothetical protein
MPRRRDLSKDDEKPTDGKLDGYRLMTFNSTPGTIIPNLLLSTVNMLLRELLGTDGVRLYFPKYCTSRGPVNRKQGLCDTSKVNFSDVRGH